MTETRALLPQDQISAWTSRGAAHDGAAVHVQLQKQQRRFAWYFLLVFLASVPLLNPWVRGDGVGYYAYVRAPLIEHSLDFTHDYQSANQRFRETRCDINGQPKREFRTTTGHLENHFSVGPGMLWAPFLLTAHMVVLLARALGSHIAADGFSTPYRYAMALGTGIYGFLGLLLSFRLARKYVGPLWALMATLGIWWGSSLPVYMYFNPSWSHAHSAFVVALFLYYWDGTREQRSAAQWILLGLLAGLMLDVYYVNLMVLAVVAVEAIWQYWETFRSTQSRGARSWQLFARQVLFVCAAGFAMIPTFVSRSIIYGGPFNSGYVSIRDYLWTSPVFWEVLFSANHGLLSWTPLVTFAIVGLLLFMMRLPKVGIPFFGAVLAFYLFISFYPDWAGISSYGNRFFISLTALFILGLAYLLERFAAWFRQPRAAVVLSAAVLACFVLWNLGLIYQWGAHLIPPRGAISFRQAAHNEFTVVPQQISSQMRHYLFRRGEMMRQIELRDLEQEKNAHD